MDMDKILLDRGYVLNKNEVYVLNNLYVNTHFDVNEIIAQYRTDSGYFTKHIESEKELIEIEKIKKRSWQ